MQYLPSVAALITVAILASTGLAVLSQVRWRAVKEWESLAEARGLQIERLVAEIASMKAEVVALKVEIEALTRMNLKLQRNRGKP